ncbi:MAG: hypothetical protein JSS10_03350 [Verrucomicrobia bacterium]|nr:hypothetical protein [Verrucomicrobiota bacterium]
MDGNLKKVFFLLGAKTLLISSALLHADAAPRGSTKTCKPASKQNQAQEASLTPAAPHYPHFFVAADLLYLKAQEEGLDYAIKNKAPFSAEESMDPNHVTGWNPQSHGRVKNGGLEWDFGCRVGAGYRFYYDRWDVALVWTHFDHGDTKKTHIDPSKETLFVTRTHPDATNPDGPDNTPILIPYYAEKARAKWDLDYDTLDLNLSRACKLNRYTMITPMVSVRAARINQDFDVKYYNLSMSTFFAPDFGGTAKEEKVDIDNNFLGIGPRIGLNLRFLFNQHWSLYANGSGSLLWSLFRTKTVETRRLDSGAKFPEVDMKDSIHDLAFNADLSVGIQWDQSFCDDKYRLQLGLGWEQLIWIDQNQMVHFTNFRTKGIFSKDHGDLSLSGIRFGARFDF